MQKSSPQPRQTANSKAPTDRRVRRTREALRDALLSLLTEVGWDHIDVAALCERANVGRSTFYLHYADKTALLRGAFGDLQANLHRPAADGDPTVRYPFLRGLLDHVHEQRAVFRALLGRRSGQVVREHFIALLVGLFADTEVHPARRRSARSALPGARSNMLAGSLFQLLVWWLADARPVPPQDIAGQFLAFAVVDTQT